MHMNNWRKRACDVLTGLRVLAGDRRGAVAIIFVIALVPLVAAGGAAIDISRAYLVKQRLGYAIDAAGLAVGSSSGTEAELNAIMLRFFQANYPAGEVGVPATPSMTIVDGVVTITADAEVNTTLMRIVGVDNITVSARVEVVRETKGLEVVLVLDNTGSMAGTKITSLKTAATDFTNILFGKDTVSTNLKIGIVPFAGTVNIGTSRESPYTKGPGAASYSPTTWGGCVEARNGVVPTDQEDTWVNNTAHQWRRYLWPTHSSRNNWPPVTSTRGPNKQCPVAVLPLTNVKSEVTSKITAMVAAGVTHINLGAVWGWRVLSPGEPFTEGRAYGDPDYNKAIIIMTDGENFISDVTGDYSAYGALSQGRLGTTSQSAAITELNNRLLTVCTGMKALDIIVYTITFQSTPAAFAVMRSCATDAGKAFESPTNADLESTFRAIGAQLSNLRLGR